MFEDERATTKEQQNKLQFKHNFEVLFKIRQKFMDTALYKVHTVVAHKKYFFMKRYHNCSIYLEHLCVPIPSHVC